MEKDHRLFLRNLPPDIDNNKLQKLLEEHGNIKNIDIKDKIQNDGSRIAFVNITTTDAKLNTCFRAVNGTNLDGYELRIEVAKESFLDRLKREREEAANRKKPNEEKKISHDCPIEKINIKTPANIKAKATKKIYNFDEFGDDSVAQDDVEKTNDNSNFSYDPALQTEIISIKKPLKIERQIPEEIKPKIEKIEEKEEKKILSESEIKRLASMRQKREAFRAKGLIISSSLKAVDSSNKNKKVVFSDDIDKIVNSEKKESKSLFDDDDDDQGDWSIDKFQHDEKRSAKLAMSLNNLGRDKRFALDERFLDDDETSKMKVTEENDENDLKNETKWQLDILQNVLGKPFKSRDENLNVKKQNKMVRYDPTASGHQAHELEMIPKSTKIKKRKIIANEIEKEKEEEAPVVVSSDVFYSVSENLTESLKVKEEFSLLKTFGTATTTDKNKSDDYSATLNSEKTSNWDAKNPFKYESSDDEEPDPSIDQLTSKNDSYKSKTNNYLSATKETFFYDVDDQLFRDVEEFFKTKPSTTGNFPSVRRELKQIVRSKVRNNIKKNTPWRNKKIGKKPKAR